MAQAKRNQYALEKGDDFMSTNGGGHVGPKTVVKGKEAVAASQHPIVTDTMIQVMKDGGNAVDAAIAGCLVQATVQQDMTNHTGTVTFLYYEAATGETYQLNAMGTIVPDLAPCRPIPPGTGMYAPPQMVPYAVIPGFMPGMKAMYERFATKPWDDLCQSAIKWAGEGHVVNSFEHLVLAQTVDFYLHTASGREHFTPNGHLPQVGDRWPKPVLAGTLKRLAEEGPDYFISGEWAEHFVERANQVGWKIEMEHMTAIPPRWCDPLRYPHRGYEIVQLAPPERQAVYCAVVLGVLKALDVTSMGHYSESAEALYYMAHALRRAAWETGLLNDPEIFETPTETFLSEDFHKTLAELLRMSRPKVDLTKHVELTSGPNALAAAGVTPKKPDEPAGSCELSIVDPDGNWVQMMNTLQSGGIPGEVVDGVPMVGSHGSTSLASGIAGWFTGGGRMRSLIGNTIVFKNGVPSLSLGTPGNVHCTIPQVLSNILDYGMDPYEAIDAPRILPMEDEYKVGVESRIPESVVAGLAKMGVLVKPLPRYDYHMGTFQMSWRDEESGLLNSTVGPRRAGQADGF
jgi:gamma-glutamyltranspeptidase/glutathione hydrolase